MSKSKSECQHACYRLGCDSPTAESREDRSLPLISDCWKETKPLHCIAMVEFLLLRSSYAAFCLGNTLRTLTAWSPLWAPRADGYSRGALLSTFPDASSFWWACVVHHCPSKEHAFLKASLEVTGVVWQQAVPPQVTLGLAGKWRANQLAILCYKILCSSLITDIPGSMDRILHRVWFEKLSLHQGNMCACEGKVVWLLLLCREGW